MEGNGAELMRFWPRPLLYVHVNVNQFDSTICISQN